MYNLAVACKSCEGRWKVISATQIKENDKCPICGGKLHILRSIEHISNSERIAKQFIGSRHLFSNSDSYWVDR